MPEITTKEQVKEIIDQTRIEMKAIPCSFCRLFYVAAKMQETLKRAGY